MPNTIEQNLQRLVNAKSAISEAITAKGGTVNNGDGFEDFPADIATIPSGGGGSGDASKPVRFMDYDGSIVASYTPEEFAELTEMPANPSHDGLTAQGWNWTLSDAKEYVSNYGTLDVGQMYITSDGRTRLYVRMQEGRLSPVLKLYLNANTELDIDWGDDTSHSTFASTSANYKSERHTYASAGNYVVSVGAIRGSFSFPVPSNSSHSILFTNDSPSSSSADRGYSCAVRKIEIGDDVTSIEQCAFAECWSLSQITIPNSVTNIAQLAFRNCYSLSQITIPNSVTTIRSETFRYCRSLSQITIPNSVTSIEQYAFADCLSLSQITIPNSVTSIGADAFHYCHSLSQITIPNSVTRIRSETFNYCYALSQITIPNSVTAIEKAFIYCYSLGYVKFVSRTPPTVGSYGAWSDVPRDCKILVPRGTLSTYKSATNYPSPSLYTYEEYDV